MATLPASRNDRLEAFLGIGGMPFNVSLHPLAVLSRALLAAQQPPPANRESPPIYSDSIPSGITRCLSFLSVVLESLRRRNRI